MGWHAVGRQVLDVMVGKRATTASETFTAYS